MMLPDFLSTAIKTHFKTSPVQVRGVGGGSINHTAQVALQDGRTVFAKWHPQPATGMFPAEAHGLHCLAAARAVRVPEPLLVDETYLVMTWLGRGKGDETTAARQLGAGLARQHRHTAETYGLERNNFCGLTPQDNQPASNWPHFFATRRLGAQLDLARRRNRLPGRRRQKLERLITRLPELLPANPPPSLLHGDLWGGNWLVAADGQPALIDPAVYFGHREADLAFTELFGGFPPAFYQAYRETWPLEAGYEARKELYNLYHLLNHLNLFGESYGGSVDAILNRFA